MMNSIPFVPNTFTPEKSRTVFKQIRSFTCVLLLFAIVAAVGCRRSGKVRKITDSSAAAPTTNTARAPEHIIREGDSMPVPPAPSGSRMGLDKSRAAFMQTFEGDGFTFLRGADKNGMESWVGTRPGTKRTIIQFVGPAENIAEAVMIVTFDMDEAGNMTQRSDLHAFAAQFGTATSGWVHDVSSDALSGTAFERTKRVGALTLTLVYTPVERAAAMTLTVRPTSTTSGLIGDPRGRGNIIDVRHHAMTTVRQPRSRNAL